MSDKLEEDETARQHSSHENNQGIKMLKNVSKIEEDHDHESETPLLQPLTKQTKHRISPSPYPTGSDGLRQRQRGLSNVDISNLRNYKLNTSAALQKDFDKVLKDKRKNMKNKQKDAPKPKKVQGTVSKPDQTKRKQKLFLNGEKVKPVEDPFKGFDYFGGASPKNNNTQINLSNQKDQFKKFNKDLDQKNLPDLRNVRSKVIQEQTTPVQLKETTTPMKMRETTFKLPMFQTVAKPDPVRATPVKPFSDAVKIFKSKVGKFQLRGPDSLAFRLKKQKWAIANPQPKKTTVERTASFSHLDMVQEPSEDDMQPGNVVYQAAKNLGADDSLFQERKLRKNSSQQSLLSMVSMSSKNSSISKGFWPSHNLNRSKRSSFNSQIDYKRYVKHNSRQLGEKNSMFHKRRAKQNLERDLKWNGPYDEDFFRCLEQYLDQAISKLVCQKEPSLNFENSKYDSAKHSSNNPGDKAAEEAQHSPVGVTVLDQEVEASLNTTSKKEQRGNLFSIIE